jgi:hypothetical protein
MQGTGVNFYKLFFFVSDANKLGCLFLASFDFLVYSLRVREELHTKGR